MLPLYLAKHHWCWYQCEFFWIMQQNILHVVCIPMAKLFIYLFTAMLRDVTITSLLCFCIICYKTNVYPLADSFVNGSTSVETLWFRSECRTWVRQTWSSLILAQKSIVRTIFDSSWKLVCCLISKQNVVNTNGHFNRMVHHQTQYVIGIHRLSEEREDWFRRA